MTHRCCGLGKPGFIVLLVALSAFSAQTSQADGCLPTEGRAPCFDANSLWLPAGRATFATIPDTRVNAPRQMSFGFASELLHSPVLAHVSSPDSGGRDVHVVDYALDASLFLALGLIRNFEVALTLPTRLYQSGAGAGGITAQSAPPVAESAVRDPRLGLAYSLDDALARPELGLRLGLDLSLPLGERAAFAGERSLVAMPSTTFGWQMSRFGLRASLGARLREPVDFGDIRLESQLFIAAGGGVDVLGQGLLFLSLEAFVLPPLGSSRAAAANPTLTEVSLVPSEWLFSARSSFGPSSEWSLSASAGTGLPFSSETRRTSDGSSTAYFLGVTSPEWRTLLALRFAPN